MPEDPPPWSPPRHARLTTAAGMVELHDPAERLEAAGPREILDQIEATPGWWAGWIAYDGATRFTRYRTVRQAPAPPASPAAPAGASGGRDRPAVRASLDRTGYVRAVELALEAIGRGDCYQVNLCTRFDLHGVTVDPARAWSGLVTRLRPEFATLLADDDRQVACLSPERFLEVDGDRVRTSPIKGTRPRGRTTAADRRVAEALAADPKERAENIMIVDLLRNDLGRVAALGSIRTPELLRVRTYPHLHHMVSTVEADLAPGRGLADLLEATFPCGSVTGAPKLAAMRLIGQLEPAPRGVSMGAVGWIRSTGDARTRRARLGVAIRTVELAGGRASFCAGSGIVAASDPAAEHDELLLKADALLRALGAAADPAGSGAAPGPPA